MLVGESLGALSEHEHERGKPGGVNREVTSYKSSPGGYRVNSLQKYDSNLHLYEVQYDRNALSSPAGAR